MNNPEKAREPSMDEILASIRKIIAEEPSDARAESEGTANPLLTGTALRHERTEKPLQMNDRPRPSLDRLSSALKARATTPPAPPPAVKRPVPFSMEPPSSFEDDLADLLDARMPARSFAGDLPRLNPLTSNPFASKDDAAPIAAPASEVENIVIEATGATYSAEAQEGDAAAATMEQAEPASASSDTAEDDSHSTPPVPPKPPLLSPWESMRKKNGFWPPQAATVSPPAPAPSAASETSASGAVNGSFVPGSGPFPSKEAQQAHNSTAPTTTADLIARLHAGLTEPADPPEPDPAPHLQFSVPPGASAAPPMPPYAAAPAPQPHLNGTYANEVRTNGMGYSPTPPPPSNFVPPYPQARPADPAPIPQAPAPDPYPRPLSTDAVMNAALSSLMNGGALPPNFDPYARPQQPADTASRYQASYGQNNYSNNNYSTNNYATYEPDPTVAAAAAFDALAQGLAASSRPEPRRPYDHQHQTHASPSHTALVAQPLLPAVQEYHPQAIRTLEDAVAEMLKPMLQRWLSDNMPRIIERALRVEAASGMKPPGSS